MLADPSPGDWLTWRRTHDGLGFSPLTHIDKNNVSGLQLAWSLALPPGPNTATPLVHDGVIYVHSFGDHVQALDAKTGDELWHYARTLPSTARPTVKRNMALYGDKIYFGTSDVHVVALDARTGAVVWDMPITEPGSGFGLSGGPLVARGKVMQGVNGQAPGGAYIVALDAESGAEAWRFYTIARPGEPGGESWNGLPLEQRTGGSVWTAGSYDAERNLAFFGPAPTYDTGPLRDAATQRGVTNEALYTNATIALNPDTGALVWHFQHVPNDQWDFDWAFERQLVSCGSMAASATCWSQPARKPFTTRSISTTADATSSRSISGCRTSSRRSIRGRARKTIDPRLVPSRESPIVVCPHAGGAKSWVPASINPATKVLYRAARRIVHGSDAGAAGSTRLVVDGRALDDPAAAGQRRALRPHSGDRSRPRARRCGPNGNAPRRRRACSRRPAGSCSRARSTGGSRRTTTRREKRYGTRN